MTPLQAAWYILRTIVYLLIIPPMVLLGILAIAAFPGVVFTTIAVILAIGFLRGYYGK